MDTVYLTRNPETGETFQFSSEDVLRESIRITWSNVADEDKPVIVKTTPTVWHVVTGYHKPNVQVALVIHVLNFNNLLTEPTHL